MHQRLLIALNITPQQLVQYYEGTVSTVVACTTDGRTVRFPASVLRGVVQPGGVHGLFELTIDTRGKFVSIQRVANV